MLVIESSQTILEFNINFMCFQIKRDLKSSLCCTGDQTFHTVDTVLSDTVLSDIEQLQRDIIEHSSITCLSIRQLHVMRALTILKFTLQVKSLIMQALYMWKPSTWQDFYVLQDIVLIGILFWEVIDMMGYLCLHDHRYNRNVAFGKPST